MDRLGRTISHRVRRAGRVERFVRLVVGGGIAMVIGLWLVAIFSAWSLPWLLGAGLVLLGIGSLAVGIWSEINY